MIGDDWDELHRAWTDFVRVVIDERWRLGIFLALIWGLVASVAVWTWLL